MWRSREEHHRLQEEHVQRPRGENKSGMSAHQEVSAFPLSLVCGPGWLMLCVDSPGLRDGQRAGNKLFWGVGVGFLNRLAFESAD